MPASDDEARGSSRLWAWLTRLSAVAIGAVAVAIVVLAWLLYRLLTNLP